MSRGYKNRKKEQIRQRKLAGLDPHPHRNQLMTPRSKRVKQLQAIWRERTSPGLSPPTNGIS